MRILRCSERKWSPSPKCTASATNASEYPRLATAPKGRHSPELLNRSSTIIWHHIAMLVREADRLSPFYGDKLRETARLSGTDMPDDHHPLMPRRNPEDIDLGRIQSDLEFLIERVSRLPTRQEQALKPLYTMVGSAAIVIAWIESFRRCCF
jgi:hypothetical protein